MGKKKIGVLIGRLQPFHIAHKETLKIALAENDHVVLILGSACQAKTIKNPWTTAERERMVRSCLTTKGNGNLTIIAAKDYFYNDNMWLTAVQSSLSNIHVMSDECVDVDEVDIDDCDVTLYGHDKDKSTFYLHMFPKWTFKDVGELPADQRLRDEIGSLDATRVRELFFSGKKEELEKLVPPPVFEFLCQEMVLSLEVGGTTKYGDLVIEFDKNEEYKAQWKGSPFSPTFVTADAIVVKSGHVLVVKRGGYPGKGLLALPGGFLEQDEKLVDACLRELKEETRIALPKDELRKRIIDQRVFDHPGRSLRGRTITHGYCIDLGSGDLPKVKGSDDAERAFWMPLRDVFRREEEFFEDHFHIIFFFTNRF
jgi:bifunctional NMN adenylyltransferase/nudix hydrolase